MSATLLYNIELSFESKLYTIKKKCHRNFVWQLNNTIFIIGNDAEKCCSCRRELYMFTFHFEFPVSIGLIDDVILSNKIKHKLSIFYSEYLGFN
jgi:hypothetical protein